MARPRKEVNPSQVKRLAEIHCTMEEIGRVLQVSVDTLERRFADVIKEGRAKGCTSLRRTQYKLALQGHPTMLVWLGKQILGQRDRTEVTNVNWNLDTATPDQLDRLVRGEAPEVVFREQAPASDQTVH